MEQQPIKKPTPTFSRGSLYFIIISLSILAILIISVLVSRKKSTSTIYDTPTVTSTPEIKQERIIKPQPSPPAPEQPVRTSQYTPDTPEYIKTLIVTTFWLLGQTKVECVITNNGVIGIALVENPESWTNEQFLGTCVGAIGSLPDSVWRKLNIESCLFSPTEKVMVDRFWISTPADCKTLYQIMQKGNVTYQQIEKHVAGPSLR